MTDSPVTVHIDQPFDLTSSLNSGQSHRWVRTDSPYGPSNEWRLGIMLGHLVQIRQVSGNGTGEHPWSCAQTRQETLTALRTWSAVTSGLTTT